MTDTLQLYARLVLRQHLIPRRVGTRFISVETLGTAK